MGLLFFGGHREPVLDRRSRAARHADTAALFQALDGGWWNRGDIKS
jgi:hypothetical protein